MTPGKVTTTSDNASNADLSLCAEVSHKDDAPTADIKDIKKPIVSSDSDISNLIERNDTKNNDTAQKAKQPFDEKLKLEVNLECEILTYLSGNQFLKCEFCFCLNE